VKIILRILAAVVLIGAVAFWAAKGAHHGWTINNIEHYTTDPVTGLTGVTYEKGFIPGYDFLAMAALIAGAMTSASFLFQKKRDRHRRRSRTQTQPS
jgi:TRAP-type C4-dicarboxylate transport system permease small subunit